MRQVKEGDKVEFIWFNGQVISGEIVKVKEHNHWFKLNTYSYCIKYPVANSFDPKQIIMYSTTWVKEDEII